MLRVPANISSPARHLSLTFFPHVEILDFYVIKSIVYMILS